MAQDREAEAIARHKEEATRLRAEVEALVQRARVLLHGEAHSKPPQAKSGKRAEREHELEAALEKAEWYRKESKRLQQELASVEERPVGLANAADVRGHDPMELQNLVAQKRKELHNLKKSGEGLDKIARAQRKAEAAQNALSPQVEERLKHAKEEVEQQKRLNMQLFAERQKLAGVRKKLDGEVRAAQNELRSREKELPVAARGAAKERAGHGQGKSVGPAHRGESAVLKQLRRDVDIIREAIRQDDRKFKASQREEEQEADAMSRQVATLEDSIAKHEEEVSKIKGLLDKHGLTPAVNSPRR